MEATIRVIEGRWKVLVLHHLLEGTLRFNEVQRKVPESTPRTLAKQLREMERDGIVRRKAFPEVPPRVEYSLTRLGRSLEPILLAMHEWGGVYSHRIPPRAK
jgi:DNA-binding HxlR family transcriptional regulator